MPVYTYQCEACGVRFEQFQKFSDPDLIRCPECNKKALRKVFTPVGIIFKGSGFYATDHRSPSGQNRTGSSSSTEDKPSTESSKPETDSKVSEGGKNGGGSAPSTETKAASPVADEKKA